MLAETNSITIHNIILVLSPVCTDSVASPFGFAGFRSLAEAAALMVNSVVAVPVSETIASVCLPQTEFPDRKFQSDNGAAFLYCVVGSIQVFAVYLYLLEVFISCIGSKGKTVLCAFLPATVCPGCDDDLEIGSNRTADSTFAIVIAVTGGRMSATSFVSV